MLISIIVGKKVSIIGDSFKVNVTLCVGLDEI
jgi:hypothetical protein